MDPFNVDLMACTVSVLRSPVRGKALPFSPNTTALALRERLRWCRIFQSHRVLISEESRPLGFVSHPQLWQVTLCNTWRNARLMLSRFC